MRENCFVCHYCVGNKCKYKKGHKSWYKSALGYRYYYQPVCGGKIPKGRHTK